MFVPMFAYVYPAFCPVHDSFSCQICRVAFMPIPSPHLQHPHPGRWRRLFWSHDTGQQGETGSDFPMKSQFFRGEHHLLMVCCLFWRVYIYNIYNIYSCYSWWVIRFDYNLYGFSRFWRWLTKLAAGECLVKIAYVAVKPAHMRTYM